MKINLKEFFPKHWINTFSFILVFLFFIGLIGSAISLDLGQASDILEQAQELIPEDIDARTIFLNNFRIAMIMMIPIIGLMLGVLIIFQTGMVFGAAGSSVGISGILLYIVTALTPFFWLEFIAYAASITEGIYIIRGIIEKKINLEIKRILLIIILNFSLLLFGAIIEIFFI